MHLWDCGMTCPALKRDHKDNFSALVWGSADVDVSSKLFDKLLGHAETKPNSWGCDGFVWVALH